MPSFYTVLATPDLKVNLDNAASLPEDVGPNITVTSISPNTAEDNESTAFAVTGTGFDSSGSGAQLTLARSGESDIACTGESYTGSTQIDATCDLDGATRGFWNVVVTNPDLESGELTNGLEVVESTPNITSISPTSASNFNTALTLTTFGTSFDSGGSAEIRLEMSGESDIVCTSYALVSSTEANASCNLLGVATGDWDVRVTDSGGDFDVLNGLLVIQPIPNDVNKLDWTPDGDHLALAHATGVEGNYPLTIIPFDDVNGVFDGVNAATATTPATGNGLAVEFAPDALALVVGTDDDLYGYTFASDNLGDPPTVFGSGLQVNDTGFHPSSTHVAIAHEASPFLQVVPFTTSTAAFGNVITTSATASSTACNGADWHPSGSWIAFACETSPFLFVYEWSGSDFDVKLTDSASGAAAAAGLDVKFAPDGDYIALGINNATGVEVYSFDDSLGSIGGRVAAPATTPGSACNEVAWLNDSDENENGVACASVSSAFVHAWPFNRTTGAFGTKLADPSTLPDGAGNSVQFHPDNDYIAVGHNTTQFLTAYDYNPPSGSFFTVRRGFLFFNTAAIPDDATIDSVTLRLYGSSDSSATDFVLRVVDASFAGSSIAVGDFDIDSWTPLASLGSINTSSWAVGSFNEISISDTSAVNVTGTTTLGLISVEDINNSAPTGNEYVSLQSQEAANDPELVVEYLTATLTATGVATAQHTITISSDGSTFSFDVDATTQATAAAVAIPDTTTGWRWWRGGSVVYGNSVTVSVSGTQVLRYNLNDLPALTITDRSGNGNTGTMSFPGQQDNLGFSVGVLTSTSTPQRLVDSSVPETVSQTDPIPDLTGDSSVVGLPLGEVAQGLTDTSGGHFPAQWWYIMGFGLLALILGGAVYNVFQDVTFAAVAIAVVLLVGGLLGGGIIPYWVLIISAFIMVGSVIVFKRVLA